MTCPNIGNFTRKVIYVFYSATTEDFIAIELGLWVAKKSYRGKPVSLGHLCL